MANSLSSITSKSEIRKAALARRKGREQREQASHQIHEHLRSLPEWTHAHEVLFYIDAHSEVMTRTLLQESLAIRGGGVVPVCQGDSLELVRIHRWDELKIGSYGILEPRPEIHQNPLRQVAPAEIDLVLVPGVAFDSRGGRLGYGKGYYDRLLANIPDRSLRIGLAFECQIVEELPREDHDIPVHRIITESRVIDCTSTEKKSEQKHEPHEQASIDVSRSATDISMD